jgi:hypothetical protein
MRQAFRMSSISDVKHFGCQAFRMSSISDVKHFGCHAHLQKSESLDGFRYPVSPSFSQFLPETLGTNGTKLRLSTSPAKAV